MVGITSYGTYIPKYRIKLSEIATSWRKDSTDIAEAFLVSEKTVPNSDEDAITLGIEASLRALQGCGIDPKKIGSLFVGSESHPYAINPSSTIIAEALGLNNNYFAVDTTFACKAATAALQLTAGLVGNAQIEYGLVIGTDTAQAKPHDVLEYTSASAACAYILGNNDKEIIAKILDTSSFSSNTSDFWRRDGIKYPSHFGRFTGQPAYFAHILGEAMVLLDKSQSKPEDYDYCVFHMPNGRFPRTVAKKLGFTKKQLSPSLTVDTIGNPYTASALLGLAAVLDVAKPGAKIFFVSYGSGAGADGFIFETTRHITKYQKNILPVRNQMLKKQYITYLEYLQKTHKL